MFKGGKEKAFKPERFAKFCEAVRTGNVKEIQRLIGKGWQHSWPHGSGTSVPVPSVFYAGLPPPSEISALTRRLLFLFVCLFACLCESVLQAGLT